MLKLTNRYIYLSLISKMKVKYATQVFSHTVANFINIILVKIKYLFLWNKI